METFYPDIKAHISPSALASWINNKSGFIRSYFKKEKGPETAAMSAGTKVHKLIEAGLIPAKCSYDKNEEEIQIQFGPKDVYKALGRPDSWTSEPTKGVAEFVDYKTGKENNWKEKLPADLKMKMTAWLVWKATGEPKLVRGCVEYIATEWDGLLKEVVPIDGRDTEVIKIEYHGEDLAEFEKVLLKAVKDINRAYEKWKDSTDKLVSKEEMEKYEELKEKKARLEVEIEEVGERIMAQMETGYTASVPGPNGTFYITEKKTYEYPEDLSFRVGEKRWTLTEAEEVEAAMDAAKKNFALTADPKTSTRSIGYRPAKKK